MSELIARHVVDVYYSYYAENPFGERSQVYLKSEADKVIAEMEESHKMEVEQLLIEIVDLKNACNDKDDWCLHTLKREHHNKYKRCLVMARWCHNQREIYERDSYNWELNNEAVASLMNKANIMRKWRNRWLELAAKFKGAK